MSKNSKLKFRVFIIPGGPFGVAQTASFHGDNTPLGLARGIERNRSVAKRGSAASSTAVAGSRHLLPRRRAPVPPPVASADAGLLPDTCCSGSGRNRRPATVLGSNLHAQIRLVSQWIHGGSIELGREERRMMNCLGAIDGTHVPVTMSPESAAPLRNRKGTLSHNVMIACDFDLMVTYISCGWEDSATDARVLRSAMINGFKVPNGKFYLVDGGCVNTPSFLAPYRGVRYHLKEFGHGRHRPQNYKELFNHRHAVLRNMWKGP